MFTTWSIIQIDSENDEIHDLSLFEDGVWVAQAHVEYRGLAPFITAFDVHPAYYGHGAAAELYKEISVLGCVPTLIDEALATADNGLTAAENLIHQFDSGHAGNDIVYSMAWTESFDPKLIERAKTDPEIARKIEFMEFCATPVEMV